MAMASCSCVAGALSAFTSAFPRPHELSLPCQSEVGLRSSLASSKALCCSSSQQGRRKHVSFAVKATKSSSSSPSSRNSIICSDCEGNGAKVCTQCKGDGLNLEDHFDGRFKAGQICWLCRGKKQILCGNCNGAGFVGGFLSTQDD